jgi:hypothetical protein
MIEIDVEMPKSCSECFAEYDYINCQITDKHLSYTDFDEKRMEDCPLRKKKYGEWIDKGSLSCRCSECGCKNDKETKFCPNCGAEMRKGDI